MKKLIFAATAAALAGIFCIGNASCSSKNADKAEADSTAVGAAPFSKTGDAFEPTTNIRYYDMDSVLANYELVKVFEEYTRTKMLDLQSATQSKQAEIQRLQASIENKARSGGYLSEASYNADMQEYQKKATAAQNYLANLEAKAQQEAMGQQIEVLDSIHSFLVDYNAERHYDAILISSPGTLFNPALNITDEVIRGLNANYRKSHPADSKAPEKK